MKLIAFDTLGPRVHKNTNDSNFSLYVSLNSSPKVPPPPCAAVQCPGGGGAAALPSPATSALVVFQHYVYLR